ncbi:MAG: Thioredoxin-like protein [Ramlibacter sp.]|nr:Thioredoxin-like protein [Ramlibacter sp.]
MRELIDRAKVVRRIESLNVLIRSHAGEIELVDLSPSGVVTVRYTGMCAGCEYRPVTTAGTVEPGLLDVPGVTRVRVLGARVSDDAMQRIQATMDSADAAQRAVRLVRRIEIESTEETQGET